MDDASLTEIISILQCDATRATSTDFFGTQKGKNPPNTITDQDLALRAWQDEVSQYSTLAEDRRMALSIASAIRTDRQIVTAANDEEARAAEDRRLAMRLAGRRQRQAAQNQAQAQAQDQAHVQYPPQDQAKARDSQPGMLLIC